jgi:hypothetical protein
MATGPPRGRFPGDNSEVATGEAPLHGIQFGRPPIGGRVKMMSNDASQGGIQVNRRLLVGGGVLVGIGGLLGFTGMVLVGSALLSATRQWINQLERPPSEIARRKWQQARAAASAGAEAWRNGPRS